MYANVRRLFIKLKKKNQSSLNLISNITSMFDVSNKLRVCSGPLTRTTYATNYMETTEYSGVVCVIRMWCEVLASLLHFIFFSFCFVLYRNEEKWARTTAVKKGIIKKYRPTPIFHTNIFFFVVRSTHTCQIYTCIENIVEMLDGWLKELLFSLYSGECMPFFNMKNVKLIS